MNRDIASTGYLRLNWLAANSRRGAEIALRVFYAILPFFVWAAVASFLGFLVGFSAVVLPPTGTFGIVAVVGLVLLWVTPDLPNSAGAFVADRFRHCRFLHALHSELLRARYSRSALDLASPVVSHRTDLAARDRDRRIVPLPRRNSKKAGKRKAHFDFPYRPSRLVRAIHPGDEKLHSKFVSVVDNVLTFYVPFFVCLYLFTSTAKVERFIETICWYSLFVALLGIVEFRLQRQFYFDIMPRWYLEALMEANPAVAAMVTVVRSAMANTVRLRFSAYPSVSVNSR